MRIALAQINTTVGDFAGNLQKVKDALDEGRRQSVDLVVFPEQTIPGYPAEDLLERADFLDAIESCFDEAVSACQGIAMVIGTAIRAGRGEGKPIFNSAVLVENGEVLGVQHKTLLPTYDVFDEGRYFRPATEYDVFEFKGRKLGLLVCEDLWNDASFWSTRQYSVDPVERVVEAGADLIVSVSASPFSLGRPRFRYRMLANAARKFDVDLIYSNLVGGNTSLVFDGVSMAVDRRGQLIGEGAAFAEDFVVIDLESAAAIVSKNSVESNVDQVRSAALGVLDYEEVYSALVLGVRDYLGKTGFNRVVIGLSGGIDSALTAAVAVDALGAENVTGVSMPSRYSSDGSVTDAETLAQNLGIALHRLPIESIFSSTLETLAVPFEGLDQDVTEENLQARIRGLLLMAFSNKFGSLLLTTGNKSEVAVGYCTLYGDMNGGLAVISDVPKTLVFELCRWRNRDGEVIPNETITKPPSAELRPDQLDQDSLPPYDVLDAILEAYVENQQSPDEIEALGFERAIIDRIIRLVDLNEYKRKQMAPGLRVTSKAFGRGRRFPIVERFHR